MKITSGKIAGAKRCIIYGPEGIGKSTFAAAFPGPLFIDTEGSTKEMDVPRLPAPESWAMLMQEIEYVRRNPNLCTTLVIDTADWAEKLCLEQVCAQNKWASIETPGYGKGYVVAAEEFGRLLNALDMLVALGINVLLCAHAMMRKFEQPDEMGTYDRWELKLSKKAAPMVKEWADLVLFANYKTFVVKDGNKGKAQGGQRVMYTTHHPAWDAKNRAGLPEELAFDFAHIAHYIPGKGQGPYAYADSPEEPEAMPVAVVAAPEPVIQPAVQEPVTEPIAPSAPAGIPDALWQLMKGSDVTEEQLRWAVFKRGYYPYETPVSGYDPSFINGALIGAWPQVYDLVLQTKDEMPF